MKSYTAEELTKMVCPFSFNRDGYARNCQGTVCMACHKKHERIQREDHSGGHQMMCEQALKRGRSSKDIKRDGPGGSLGKFTLEAEYICLRIEKDTKD